MSSETQTVAKYVADLKYEQIPAPVIQKLKLHLLDAAGTALYGFEMPWTRMIRDVVVGSGGTPESLIWNTAILVPAPQAAFVNSVATHAFELDDRRIASYMHPAAATLPAALATADVLGGASGRDLITAIVAGYEVGLRVGKCIGQGSFLRGFYPPGIAGSFAAAITAAKLRGMDAQAIAYVLNLTATQGAGLYSPSMIKRFNLGRGTFNGMCAVELVLAGYTGVDDIMEREIGGFVRAYADNADPAVLTDGLGQDFETLKVELKPYVSSRPNHTAIDATFELRKRYPALTPNEIDRIEIEIGTVNYNYGAGFPVFDVPSAVMSVAYCAAVALLDGEAFLDQFTQERVNDRRCQQLLKKTEVICNKQIDSMGLEDRDHTILRWRLKSGEVVETTRTYAKGHPRYPMTEAEVRTKFHRLIDQSVGQQKASALEDVFGRLEQIDSKQIGALLRIETECSQHA